MSVELWDIWYLGSADMPENDTDTQIGGAIDKTTKLSFARHTGGSAITWNAVSANAGDTTQTITVTGRDAAGEIQDTGSELALNGTTPVTSTQTLERIMKAVKSATCAGDVAVYKVTDEATGTAQAGAANSITLASGDTGTSQEWRFMVLIIESGTGAGQIREILDHNSTSKVCQVRTWDTNPDATSVYAIHEGLVMEKDAPAEIDLVTRICYDSAAAASGGGDKVVHEKGFIWNDHATLSLTNAKVDEVDLGGYAKMEFALETTLDGTGDNGAGNTRLVAPSSGVGAFSDAQKDVANSGALSAQSGQGIWFALDLNAGDAADNTFYQVELTGQSV